MGKVSGLASILVEFLSKPLIEKIFFQEKFPVDPVTLLLQANAVIELITKVQADQPEEFSWSKELYIMYKQLRGQELSAEEKRYDNSHPQLNVTREVTNGLLYAFAFSGLEKLKNAVPSLVKQGLSKHIPYLVGSTVAPYIGPFLISKLVDVTLAKSSLSENEKNSLRPWLNSVARIALAFMPKVAANKEGVVYQYPSPSTEGHYVWHKNITVSTASPISKNSLGDSEKVGEVPITEEHLSFKIVGIRSIESDKVEVNVINKSNEKLVVTFSMTQQANGDRNLEVKCADTKIEGECLCYLSEVFTSKSVQENVISQLDLVKVQNAERQEAVVSNSLVSTAADLASTLTIPSMLAASGKTSSAFLSSLFFMAATQVSRASAQKSAEVKSDSSPTHYRGKRELPLNVPVQVNDLVTNGASVGFDNNLGAPTGRSVAGDSQGGCVVAYQKGVPAAGGQSTIHAKSFKPDSNEIPVDTGVQAGSQAVPVAAISPDNSFAAFIWQGDDINARVHNRTNLLPTTNVITVARGPSVYIPQAAFWKDRLEVVFYRQGSSVSSVLTQTLDATTGSLIGPLTQISDNGTSAYNPAIAITDDQRFLVWQEGAGIMAQATNLATGNSSFTTPIGMPGGSFPIPSCVSDASGNVNCVVAVASGNPDSSAAANATLIPVSIDGSSSVPVLTVGNAVVMNSVPYYSPKLVSVALQPVPQSGKFSGLMTWQGSLTNTSSLEIFAQRFSLSGVSIEITGPNFSVFNIPKAIILASSTAYVGNDSWVVVAPSSIGVGNATGYTMIAIMLDNNSYPTPAPTPTIPSPITTVTTSSSGSGSGKNIGVIIGSTAAGIILVAGAAAIGAYCCFFRTKKESLSDVEMRAQQSLDSAPFANNLSQALGVTYTNFIEVDGGKFKTFADHLERIMTKSKILEPDDQAQYINAAAQAIRNHNFIEGSRLDVDALKSHGAQNIANETNSILSQNKNRATP